MYSGVYLSLFNFSLTLYMSIVALKRKSQRFQSHISAKGFSLNGGHRNIGAVGQTNLGRSVTRTPFRGTEPMGHGGCCGTYVRTISNSGSCCSNDPTIIKPTTKTTKGFIYSTIKHPTVIYNTSCAECLPIWPWVKDTSSLNKSQGVYIKNVVGEVARRDTEKSGDGSAPDAGINPCNTECNTKGFIGGRKIHRHPYAKTVSKATSAENYMRTSLLKNNCLPTPPGKKPFPVALNNAGGCAANYTTIEQAIEAGVYSDVLCA